jgi:hypothetical protein
MFHVRVEAPWEDHGEFVHYVQASSEADAIARVRAYLKSINYQGPCYRKVAIDELSMDAWAVAPDQFGILVAV